MFKLLFKGVLILWAACLLSFRIVKEVAKSHSSYFCLNYSEHAAKILPCSVAPAKTPGIVLNSLEDTTDNALFKKTRKANLTAFYQPFSASLINTLHISYIKAVLPNPIPIYIITHDYRI